MLHAKESVYGFSVSLATVDEAWKVKPQVIEEGVDPTMVEREQPQLLLVSTAHRMSTSLMLGRRAVALEGARGRGRDPADRVVGAAGRADRRPGGVAAGVGALVAAAGADRSGTGSAAALAGTLRAEDEPDPIESFRAQWLNQWPQKPLETRGDVEDLLPAGALGRPGRGRMFAPTGPSVGGGRGRLRARRRRRRRRENRRWPPRAATAGCTTTGTTPSPRCNCWRRGGRSGELIVGASLLERMPPRPDPTAETRHRRRDPHRPGAAPRPRDQRRCSSTTRTPASSTRRSRTPRRRKRQIGLVLVPQRGRTASRQGRGVGCGGGAQADRESRLSAKNSLQIAYCSAGRLWVCSLARSGPA